MKIALLSEKYTPDIGGLAISAERFARLLASAGHDVHVFAPTMSLSPSETWTLSLNGVSVQRFGAHKRVDDTLVDWFELIADKHIHEPFDILHGYFLTQAGFIAAYAGKYLDIPSVVSARGNDIERAVFDPTRAAHVFYALQHASAVTANATELAKKARALLPGLDVTVIPNGIDPEHFKPLPRNNLLAESLGLINEAPRVIGFAGELREKKGLRSLLSAYAQINTEKPATLLIVGDVRAGEDKKLFEEFKLSNPNANVIVTGFVSQNDLPAYYSLMDVFVHPSLRDGLPNALLEAMACEKAVIATPVGGIKDVVTDCENGRFISTNATDELAQTILELLDKESLRKKFGSTARQTIIDKFTLQAELEGNLALYRRLGLQT
ncbi:MAG TPA: glycosyltransferase family 4 protein [Anaerolineales bacterium]|nr:glycosyltransferase family 4 protein [Anaerolineales bacterium]